MSSQPKSFPSQSPSTLLRVDTLLLLGASNVFLSLGPLGLLHVSDSRGDQNGDPAAFALAHGMISSLLLQNNWVVGLQPFLVVKEESPCRTIEQLKILEDLRHFLLRGFGDNIKHFGTAIKAGNLLSDLDKEGIGPMMAARFEVTMDRAVPKWRIRSYCWPAKWEVKPTC
eukprot:jgi/Psemu1/5270/gm1.5270_g